MLIISEDTIEVIAQSIGISNLSPEVSLAFTPDVEFRVREVMLEAIQCMRHSRRTVLTCGDVDTALKLKNIEPIYGFASGGTLQFKRVVGHKDLFYIDDKAVELKNVIKSLIPKSMPDTSVTAHWLAIEGVQPEVVENSPTEASTNEKESGLSEEELANDSRVPTKHVISKDFQLYFEKIKGLTLNKSGSLICREALRSLAMNSGMQPLLPYFACFIADEISKNLSDSALLFALMRIVWRLLQNQHIHIEPYLHQLMPSIVTCLVAKRLGERLCDNYWDLKNLAASLASLICKRYGHVYHNIQPRLMKTLLHVFLDPSEGLPQHYGAVKGLADLGPRVVGQLILPNLEPYLQFLEMEKQKNAIRKYEALQVYGALLLAAGQCMHNRLKVFPLAISLPMRSICDYNGKGLTTTLRKRKASTDKYIMHQLAVKKMASESRLGAIPTNSMTVDMHGTEGKPSKPTVTSYDRKLTNEIRAGREEADQTVNGSAALAVAWKEDLDAGPLVTSLFEVFGESLFSFIPKPELCFFL